MADWTGHSENIGHLFCGELKGNLKSHHGVVLLCDFSCFLSVSVSFLHLFKKVFEIE